MSHVYAHPQIAFLSVNVRLHKPLPLMTDCTYFGNAFKRTSGFPEIPVMSGTWKGKEYFLTPTTADDFSERLTPNSLFCFLPCLSLKNSQII